jgi:hypothetical protein
MWAEVSPLRTMESGLNLERLFTEELFTIMHYLLIYIAPWSASHISYRSGRQAHPKHSDLFLLVASAEALPGHSDSIKRYSTPSHVVPIMFQGVILEALAGKLKLSLYCQTADLLSPANSRK